MYVDYSGHYVRLALRGYFIVGAVILAFLGQACSYRLVQAALAKERRIPLHHMTGWLSGFTFFASLWDLRRIPGGTVMGAVMLTVAIVAPVADLAVGGFVQNAQVPGRCDFRQGLVMAAQGPFVFNGPPVNGQPRTVAANAQLVSLANGGLQGIYVKANSDPDFRADDRDVLAGWECADVNDGINYGNAVTPDTVIQDLVGRGLIYDNYQYISLGPGLGYEHFVVWSSSADAGTLDQTWDVKASIDTSAGSQDPIVMRSFHCAVNNHTADSILSAIDSTWSLKDWLQGFQGGCYFGSGTPANSQAGTFLEQYLNSMLMVQGGNNYLLANPANGSDKTQGCLTSKTSIPPVIFVLVAIFGSLMLGTFFTWIVLIIIVSSRTRTLSGQWIKVTENEKLLDYIPSGLTSWMLHAARESALKKAIGVPTQTRMLKEWKYMVVSEGPDGSERVAKLVNADYMGEEDHHLRPYYYPRS